MRDNFRQLLILGAFVAPLAASTDAAAQSDDLAKQLSNPVASLISVPLQFNYDARIGPGRDGERLTVNVQPVIPFKLSSEWTLISRTIMPIVDQSDIFPGAGSQFGIGDIVQSFFFSPKPVPLGGGTSFIWGAGPVLLLPTGTERLLTTDKWGAGPTGVALVQNGPWTIGMLANHIWSYAGSEVRGDVSASLLNPFVSYTTKDAWTFSLNTEATYDWIADQWTVPLGGGVSKLLQLGDQPVSIGAQVRYYAESPDSGPHGVAARASLTFLFPTK